MESKITSKMEFPSRVGVSCPSPWSCPCPSCLSVSCCHLVRAGDSFTSKASRGVERGQRLRGKTELVEERDTEAPKKRWRERMVDGRTSNHGRNPSKGPGTIFIQRLPKLGKSTQEPGLVAQLCHPGTREAEPGGSEFEVGDHLGLHNETLSKGGEGEGGREGRGGEGRRSRGTPKMTLDRS